IDCARTVAVVVPSPATSEVFDATSLTICAPMFSNRFSSSISLATVTPSFVIVGAPHDVSMTTLRPRGPSVTFTALARMLSRAAMCVRALVSNTIALADMMALLSFQNREDVVLAQDDVVLAVDLHFGPGVLADQDGVARLDRELLDGAVVEPLSAADSNHLRFERFLFRVVGNEQTA